MNLMLTIDELDEIFDEVSGLIKTSPEAQMALQLAQLTIKERIKEHELEQLQAMAADYGLDCAQGK
jgi:hypothetical protein